MQNLKTKEFWIHSALFVLILVLLAGFVFLFTEVRKIKNSKDSEFRTETATFEDFFEEETTALPSASPLSIDISPVPSPTLSPLIVNSEETPIVTIKPQIQKITTYVPLNGTFSTTNTDWTDVSGAQAYVDLKNNYSTSAYVTFESSMHANDGSRVYVRLFDATHSIAVDGSEMSTDSVASTLISSAKLNLWSGNNLYKVQIKSLNSFNVYFDSARIKIVY